MSKYSADSIWEWSDTGIRGQEGLKSLAGRELQFPGEIFSRRDKMAPALQRTSAER